ncbi:MAG: hypothetical protein LBR92_03845, partial [Puniceicoccales bacterium]|nr:hypothetical protein [Puniceicoccales bacterium]
MNQSKNIIITSCLLTMFGDSSQVFGSSGGVVSHPVQPNPSPLYALACNASYLPEGLREKFKMGGYSIDEIADHLVIEVLDMNSQRLEPLVNAIKQESVPAFFERSTIGHPDMTIVFLQVGDGKYFYPDLFEKLIVVRDGTCITVQHGYRDIWGEFG